MERQPVESSNIASIGYDESIETLEVEFNHGGIYQYQNVGQNIYEAFMDAPSKGKFFNAYVKDVFSYSRM